MKIMNRDLSPEKDGLPGYLAYPARKEGGPAVMIVHHHYGVTGHMKATVCKFAELGYTTIVPDLYKMLGAADGAGLGHRFLRHLARTRLLLHIIDIAPFDETVDPVHEARAIVEELRKYDENLYHKPRWLVLNKNDMLPAEERDARRADFVRAFGWEGPVFTISALSGEGCKPLSYAIMDYLDAHRLSDAELAMQQEPAEE